MASKVVNLSDITASKGGGGAAGAAQAGPKANCRGLEMACHGRQYVPLCCSADKGSNCDGTILPTVDKDRGKDYLHSSFIDVVISGLVGIRPSFGPWLDLAPLADASMIDYFALDNVLFHGRNISIAYDKAAVRYVARGCKAVMCVWVDSVLRATGAELARMNVSLVQ